MTWLTRRCDKQGSFGAGGEVVAEYPCEWGDAPTDSADPTL